MLQLNDNAYNARQPKGARLLKIWRYAGLLLTYRCNAACRFCYYNCQPQAGGLMPVDMAVSAAQGLRRLAGDGAKIHLTGGEPFLEFERLLEICRAYQREGLIDILDNVETNGGWACQERDIADKLAALKDAGLRRLKISCDIFHQEFIPIDHVRRLAQVAAKILGADNVLVRWQADLQNPQPPEVLFDRRRLAELLKSQHVRFTGRAALCLAPLVADLPLDAVRTAQCQTAFLDAKGVHIDPYGNVFSGQCSGMVVGNISQMPLEEIWRRFDPQTLPFWKVLFASGPAGFLSEQPEIAPLLPAKIASKCHLCALICRIFFDKGLYLSIINTEIYGKQ